jgi:two-component system chemotaxis response regulator CheY
MPPKRVLIVEDDPVNRRILHKAISAAGFDVLVTGDAMSALTETQRGKPDLIILDLGLPAGGGFTFLQRVKTFPKLALIPIVVVSGQDRAASEPRALAAGASFYIEKPAKPDEVVRVITNVLAHG